MNFGMALFLLSVSVSPTSSVTLILLDDPATEARLFAGAVEHAAGFSWDATADRLFELYRGLVE